MPFNRGFRDLFCDFNAADVRYLVAGAHAVIFYTVPRYTKEVDLWVEPTVENARRVHAALARFGAPLEGVEPRDLATPGTVLQLGVEPNRIDLLTRIEPLEFGPAWARREASSYGGVPIPILGLDDLITAKRAAGRAQDLLDAEWLERARRGRR